MGMYAFLSSKFGILGIILFAMIGSFFPGIPEEVFLMSLGYIGATDGFGVFTFFEISLFLIIGLLLIDTITYWLSRSGNKIMHKFANFFLRRWFTKDESFIQSHMRKIIFFSRFIIQLHFVGAFIAGTHKYPYRKFLFVDLWALIVYVPLVLSIGIFFQERIEDIKEGVSAVSSIILIAVGVAVLFGLAKLLMSYFKTNYKEGRVRHFFGFVKIKDDEKKQCDHLDG